MNKLLCLMLVFFNASVVLAATPLNEIAIQDKGRVKPFQSFAEETLQLIHGRKTISAKAVSVDQKSGQKQKGFKRESAEIILTFLLAPEQWQESKIIFIDNLKLKKALGFDSHNKYFSMKEVLGSSQLQPLVQELETKRKNKIKLNSFFQALQKLESQVGYIRYIQSGDGFRIVPPPEGATDSTWLSLNQIDGELKDKFLKVVAEFMQYVTSKMESTEKVADSTALAKAVKDFKEAARAQNPQLYPSEKVLNYELTYNKLKPFRLAWVFYLLAAIFVIGSWIFKTRNIYLASLVLTFLGFAFHVYGFVLRILISGRAPVSNMYETVVWVPLGAIVFGAIIELKMKNKFTILGANICAFLALLLASIAPTILDPSIQPLEAVLRSNFWLSTHVTTITISYSAFFLAFVLGDINLIYFILDPKKWASKIRTINDSIYRLIQIGIILLAVGIVLGGVWADYSWGRFWGWDPKETWALIALLGYLAMLHARLVNWLKQFGMSAAAVASFSLVIMAWYGVNYVLGEGLHSYGFGAGGVEYVSVFILLHFLLIGFSWFMKNKALQEAPRT